MRIAAIDVGSNSVHMIVCRVGPDLSFEVIDREKDMIRLGAAGLEGRKLPEAAIQTALQTLSKFKRLAESHGVEEIMAAATSAVREAENGGDFIRAAQRNLGVRVRVISGTEEARLIHIAAAYAAGLGRHPAVVIDIGGGSTEITLGTAARAEFGRSFKLGVLRLTERFGRNDPLTREDERRLVRHIRRQVGAYARQLRQRGFERVIGSSGTMLSIGSLAAGARIGDDLRNARVASKDIRRLRKRLVPMTLDERLKVPGLDPRRADLAAVGAILIDTLLSALATDELTLCDFALREGLIIDYIKRNAAHIRTAERYPDVRRRSVVELAERCRYWPEHSRQVARLALDLFDATQARHTLGAREREWLEYGALLHDIGSHIGYEDHHKHSYYLIRHGGLRGFEPEEVVIIGLVARYHRKGTPKKSHDIFADLSGSQRDVVRLLSAFVRLAESFDRSHTQTVSGLAVDDGGDAIRVHLRATDDAELELWAAARASTPLAALLGAELAFDVAPPRGRRRASAPPPARPTEAPPTERVKRPIRRARARQRPSGRTRGT
jgi:exopolyphosphatase/guanosine-5'-triphosphate,3'-diphosphate pyrophosphatase